MPQDESVSRDPFALVLDQIVSSDKLSSAILTTGRELLAASKQFNEWVGTTVKKEGRSEDDWLEMLEADELAQDKCIVAWKDFVQSPDTGESLLAALREAIGVYRKWLHGTGRR